ncbi:hypothetical protein [Microbacterium sp. SLBN-146]|uniref:hypothetical protein n=1 Tax=Microbacterium sp. SLBN-146 TaxID=2768457 RepID=UPI001153AF16|nr:hypothetical protein [Microbacterium sp. SLBN-146]TQJ30382.1 hypothetical protein FBY39_0832 [Microbacterium sp. SLBN-146]
MDDSASRRKLTLADLAARIELDSAAASDDITSIRDADELARRSRERLHELVRGAHARGVSWQSIGDALGVSRQAAFKRFGHQNEGELMSQQVIDLVDRTSTVFQSLDAGDYDAVRTHMTYTCARALSKRTLMRVWSNVVEDSGTLEACTDATVQTPDGTTTVSKFLNRHLSTGAIVQTTLRHEAGEWIGRIAYNGTGKITGILIAPPGAQNLPF